MNEYVIVALTLVGVVCFVDFTHWLVWKLAEREVEKEGVSLFPKWW